MLCNYKSILLCKYKYIMLHFMLNNLVSIGYGRSLLTSFKSIVQDRGPIPGQPTREHSLVVNGRQNKAYTVRPCSHQPNPLPLSCRGTAQAGMVRATTHLILPTPTTPC